MIGQRIGSYRVVKQLGEGGMGLVYAAVNDQLGRQAAIKVLHPELAQDPDIAARFLNEARAVNIVQHPGLVDIYEIGRLDSGVTYIVMEYLEGESLAVRLRRPGGVPLAELLCVARQVASALAAAHKKGIVHRDLKPENVMVVPDPEAPLGERAKVLDFGIAKFAPTGATAGRSGRTRTGVLMGTPRYMAPEQCHGASQVDDRADVYALGVILYEALCKRPPFDSEGLGELLMMHLSHAPQPIPELAPAAPADLVALVHVMLAKFPAERPGMAQVAQILAQLGAPAAPAGQRSFPGPGPRTPVPITLPPLFPSTLGQAASQAGAPVPAPRGLVQTAAVAVLVALVTILAVEALSRRHEPLSGSAGPGATAAAPPALAGPPDGGAADARHRDAPGPAPGAPPGVPKIQKSHTHKEEPDERYKKHRIDPEDLPVVH